MLKIDRSKPWLKRAFKSFGFPFLLGAYALLLWITPESMTLLLFGFLGIGIILEKYIPYHATWQGIKTDTKVDALFSVLTIAVSVLIKGGLTVFLANQKPGLTLWPSLPLWASILLALAISGFGPYMLHRIAHEWSGLLWQIHAVHHAPTRVYSLNAMRAHPVNAAWNTLTGLLPLLFLGADSHTILIAGGLNNFFSIYNHMNIDFRNPFLSIFLNTAELHRWHHSTRKEFGDKNYSSGALTIWDHMLRSWKLPRKRFGEQDAGLYTQNKFPAQSFWKQLARPLCTCT